MRDNFLAAAEAEQLLRAVSETAYAERDETVNALVDLHNSAKIDLLQAFLSNQLEELPKYLFFHLRAIVTQALPRLKCSITDAVNICELLAMRASGDITFGEEYDALTKWLGQSVDRVQEGLARIVKRDDTNRHFVQSVLLAGASLDLRQFAETGLTLSNHSQVEVRVGAMSALGQMKFDEHDPDLDGILNRFEDVVRSKQTDQEVSVALRGSLRLLKHLGRPVLEHVETIFLDACNNPGPITRHQIAYGLTPVGTYSEKMIDATFVAMSYANRHEPRTIGEIDSALNQWDLDGDRRRVLELLQNLLTHSEDSIEIEALDHFRHRLKRQTGAILGWYVVSLLLTGEQKLCRAANELLPYGEFPNGLDSDLTPFDLDGSWVLFLARKIIGYCLVNRRSASALILACLRAVPELARAELEDVVFQYFLINYPRAFEWVETSISPSDKARNSVATLTSRLNEYLCGLAHAGECPAFQPTARHRQIQAYRQAELGREIWRSAEQQSILAHLAHRSVVLYGTATISYLHKGDNVDPVRSEMPMATFKQEAEIPRLHVLDPVGLEYALLHLKDEVPPQ